MANINSDNTNVTTNTSNEAQLPLQAAFHATVTGVISTVTGDNTWYQIIYGSEYFDIGSNFNTTTGIFTSPVTGKYILGECISYSGLAANHDSGQVNIETSNGTYITDWKHYGNARNAADSFSSSASILADMDAGDTAKVNCIVTGGSKVVSIQTANFNYFWGRLVC